MNGRPLRVGISVALLTAGLGFGMLCVFWFTGTHDPSLTGLFDYRSATVGDGLLLPVLTGVLAAAATSLSGRSADSRRRPLAALAGLGGALAGMLVIWRWHEDPNPHLNWTWPAPHDFNCAGWAHAVFLCLAAAVVSALLVYVLVSLRARRAEGDRPQFAAPALVTWAAVGMVGLILLDNQEASGTDAALATALATVAAALAAACLALWAGGRRMLPPVTVGALAGAGTVAYCSEWPLAHLELIGPAWIPALALSFALIQPLAARKLEDRLVLFSATAIVMTGALTIGAEQVVGGPLWATLLIATSAIAVMVTIPVAFATPEQRPELVQDLPGTIGVVSFVFAALLTAIWLALAEFGQQDALATLSAIELTFDALVFTLFRERFRRLVKKEAHAAERQNPQLDCAQAQTLLRDGCMPEEEKVESEDLDGGLDGGAVPSLYLTLYVYAAAALTALIILLAAAAGPIGLEDTIRGNNPDASVFLRLGVVLLAVVAIGWLAVQLVPKREGEAGGGVGLRGLFAGLAAAAALASIALIGGEVNQPVPAAAAALVYALLVVESLVFSPIRLQLERSGPQQVLLIAATGAAVFLASFWLFAVGIWSDGGPAAVWRIGLVSLVVIGSCLALAVAAGTSLARRAPREHLTLSAPDGNVILDQTLYALFMLLIGVFPISVAAQIDSASGESFALVSSLMFLPGLFGAFIWVIDNNHVHHEAEQDLLFPRKAMWAKAGGSYQTAEAILQRYKKAMRLHSRYQNRGSVAALIGALLFIAAKLMGL